MAERNAARPAPEKKTIIEDGTTFKGTLSANCAVVVRGQVEGEINGPSLDVAESGTVDGQVKVTELRSKGQLTGTFEADDVVLCGRVRDETVIIAKTLEVAPPKSGALAVELFDCELQIGEVPSKEAALREALAAGAGHTGTAVREPTATVIAERVAPATVAAAGATNGATTGTPS
ncbi:MAG TPA: polymer-forming cytoskeletal protein [Polyangia bacterium]|jgi:cytoskeletal protein CcmA (bactofilin family)